jgi:O-antigen ligase
VGGGLAADLRVEFLVQLGAVLPWAAVLVAVLAGGRGTAAWLAAGAALVQVGVWLGRAAERRARDAGAAPPP